MNYQREHMKGKVAVVTGGASGIGRAAAELLTQLNVSVVVGDVHFSEESLESFESKGIRIVNCDVREEQDVKHLINEASDSFGRLDILVNSAGVNLVKQIPQVDLEEWNRCFDINLRGAFLTCKHAIPRMQETGEGSIINISSNGGLLSRASDPVYGTSKAALNAFTQRLALCHAEDRIRVNAICPGPVDHTGIMAHNLSTADQPEARRQSLIDACPLAKAYGRMISPEEVAHCIVYLCGEYAQMITGALIPLEGGKTLGVPPYLNKTGVS